MLKVLIVDDHKLVSDGLTRLIGSFGEFKVIGQASTGEEALKLVRDSAGHYPDVVLMDLEMPGIGGLETLRKLQRISTDIKVLMLSAHKVESFAPHAFKSGAFGFLTKGCSAEELAKAIRTVHSGQKYISSELAQQLALNVFSPTQTSALSELSDREMQVLLMVTSGQSVSDIATKLHLSTKTVNSYRYRIFTKLEVPNDVLLTHLAIGAGIILPNLKEALKVEPPELQEV